MPGYHVLAGSRSLSTNLRRAGMIPTAPSQAGGDPACPYPAYSQTGAPMIPSEANERGGGGTNVGCLSGLPVPGMEVHGWRPLAGTTLRKAGALPATYQDVVAVWRGNWTTVARLHSIRFVCSRNTASIPQRSSACRPSKRSESGVGEHAAGSDRSPSPSLAIPVALARQGAGVHAGVRILVPARS